MEYTSYYNLNKPESTDAIDIGDINDNMDTLDTQMYKHETQLGNMYFGEDDNGKAGWKTSADGEVTPFRNPTGNATAARVLSGYVFSNASTDDLTGSMNNWGSNTVTLSSSNTATLSAGYYSSVSINCAARYSNAYSAGNSAGYSAAKVGTATAARVLSGYTFTNASNVGASGSMNNWGANTVTLSSSNTATLSAGYYSSVSVNAAGRYSAGYNAGYNAVAVKQMAVFAARGFGASSSDYESSNTASYTMTASGTVYYAMFSCGYNGASVVNVVYVNNSAQVSRNISSDYAWRNANGSFSANSGAVIKIVTNATAGSHAAGYCTVAIKY